MATRRATRRTIGPASVMAAAAAAASVVTVEDVIEDNDENDNNTSLFLQCEEEPLSAAQTEFHEKRVKEFQAQMKKLESLAAKPGTTINARSDGSVIFKNTTETTTTAATPIGTNPVSKTPTVAGNNYRLLMDPRTGRILGTINNSGNIQAATTVHQSNVIRKTTPTPQPLNHPSGPSRVTLPAPRLPQTPVPRQAVQVQKPTSSLAPKPTPSVKPAQVVDLTRSSSSSTPSSASGASHANAKSKFPALMVQPKPHDGQANLRRSDLDQKVKSLLVMSPAKLTEWLIKEGLVPQEQSEHGLKLKLGMYSDSKKFPNSGGYVWLTEDSRNKFVSVFKGSLFETLIQAPAVILKLIYHWTCQTSLNNVITWVKVHHESVDAFFRHMRCLCVATVQEEVINLGGANKAIELGVISLGTTTTDGNRREVKVEVLGVLERSTGKLRLRATEPIPGANQADRFARIFKPLPTWIRRDSKIIADFSIDRERLIQMGYSNVFQCSATTPHTKKDGNNNSYIMEYLKRVVPRMFQNSLSVLPTTTIQQFLDELTFREIYGKGPLQCWDNIIKRIATQTNFVVKKNSTMSTRLRTINDNPFGDWRMTYNIPAQVPAQSPVEPLTSSFRESSPVQSQRPPLKRPITQTGLEMGLMKSSACIDLENYYYGTIEGDIGVLMTEFKADMAFKCHICKKIFMNNIEFMKHLSLHVENDRVSAVDLSDLSQCKYCLKDFESNFTLQKHMDDAHYKSNSQNVCRICNIAFPQALHLISHMQKIHVRAELPYACQVCGFRTSSHREAVDHFIEQHDRTDKLQCPRCLKIFCLFSEKGGYNSSTAVAFVEHLQSHQDGKRVPCKKCCLSFKDDVKLFRGHHERDHGSFKNHEGLEMYQYLANETPLKMPKPDERGLRLAPKGTVKKMGSVQQTSFAAQNLEDLAMYDVDGNDTCKECERKMVTNGHFNAYLCCTKCRYSSCCSKALSIHVAIFHGPEKPVFNLGIPSILKNEVFCVCGFKTNSGNKIAKHLALHGCRSAYSSLESAQKSAVVMAQDEIESFDPNEVMAKAYMSKKPEEEAPKAPDAQVEQSGPLAFLGLQKRPKEDEEPKAMETDEILEDNVDMAKGDEKIEEKSEEIEEVTETKDKSDNDIEEVTETKDKSEEDIQEVTETKDKSEEDVQEVTETKDKSEEDVQEVTETSDKSGEDVQDITETPEKDVQEVTETKDKSDQDVSEVTEPENKAEENDEIMEVEDSPKPEEPSAVEENSETEKMDEN